MALETEAGLKKRMKQTNGQKDREEPLETSRASLQEDAGIEIYCRGEGKWALNLFSAG